MTRADWAATAVSVALLVALAAPGAAERGIIAEEIQPHLARYPRVLERTAEGIAFMPPHEPGAPPGPRWVATSQWPVVGYDGQTRLWPVFIRGHQTALGTYASLALAPLLGGGVAGVRLASVVLAALVVALSVLLARRCGAGAPWVAGLVTAASFGMIALGRTGYSFELASRVAMMVTLVLAAAPGPPSARRVGAIGLAGAVAVLCRATVGTALLPALAVMLLARERRAAGRRLLLAPALIVAVPVLVLGAMAALLPLRDTAVPLSGFPFGELFARTANVPRQLVLQLGWLGDATSVWGPLTRGAQSFDRLAPAALLGAVPLAAAAVRWLRRRAGEGEQVFAAAVAGCALGGAWLYRGGQDFQLALALEPLIALALAHQVGALRGRRAWAAVAIAAVLVARAQGTVRGLRLEGEIANPMLSGRCQRAAVARLEELGVGSDELLATTYNQAGVVEAWTDGRLSPVHAWPLLLASPPAPAKLQAAWQELLDLRTPRYVLLSEGANLFETEGIHVAEINAAFTEVAAKRGLVLEDAGRFPTESGAPGWRLVRIGPSSPP